MPSPREYLQTLGKEWVAVMSGLFSVLLMAVSFFVGRALLGVVFLALGVFACFYAGYRVWKPVRQRADELEARLKPHLEFEFKPGEKPYFEIVSNQSWLRIGVRNVGDSALSRVKVTLEKCEPDSPSVYLEHTLLPQNTRAGTDEFMLPSRGLIVVNVARHSGNKNDSPVLVYARLDAAPLDPPRESYTVLLRAQGEIGPAARCKLVIRSGLSSQPSDFRRLPAEDSPARGSGETHALSA